MSKWNKFCVFSKSTKVSITLKIVNSMLMSSATSEGTKQYLIFSLYRCSDWPQETVILHQKWLWKYLLLFFVVEDEVNCVWKCFLNCKVGVGRFGILGLRPLQGGKYVGVPTQPTEEVIGGDTEREILAQ